MSSLLTTTAPSRAAEGDDGRQPPRPFVLRVLEGDITQARASLIVVSHFNGVPIGGAEGAIDAALGGTISRRMALGSLDGPFGATHFLPAVSSTLAAEAVLVVSMGDPERFDPDRLPELGAALVEAVAAVGLRDAATIVQASGSTGIDVTWATRLLLEGVAKAVAVVPGAHCLRELSFVERESERLPAILRGAAEARCPASVHLYVERGTLPRTAPAPLPSQAPAVPDHLRIGVTRGGAELKVTVIGQGSFDSADAVPYPVDRELLQDVDRQVLAEADADTRAKSLEAIGFQLGDSFLCWTGSPAVSALEKHGSASLVLRVDRSTARLPWEMLYTAAGGFEARSRQMSRQLEIRAPGRVSVPPPDRPEHLEVLVIGDPAGDLSGAREEAEAIVDRLKALPGARVTGLVGQVGLDDVSAALNRADYDIVHYAGHGIFDPVTKAGGLKLAGGDLLTAADLTSRRHIPRLFFVNACHAASIGADFSSGYEPTLDLVHGLLRTGVRHFLGSQWAVNDEAARTFASAFYDVVAGTASEQVGEAVRRAREAVISAHGVGEPAWSTYALYGNPWERVK